MLIGVISDTHGLLRPEALEALAGVEHILHAGDIDSPDIVPLLTEIAPVTAIRMSFGPLMAAQLIGKTPANLLRSAGRVVRGSGSNVLRALQASHRSTLNPQRTSTRSLFVRFEHRTNGGDHV